MKEAPSWRYRARDDLRIEYEGKEGAERGDWKKEWEEKGKKSPRKERVSE